MRKKLSSVHGIEETGIDVGRLNSKPDFNNMDKCILDVKEARLDSDEGPEDQKIYSILRGKLEANRERLPPLYREKVCIPFINTISDIGETRFNEIILNDPYMEDLALVMSDIAQSIIQNGEGYQQKATDAFQEVISDLYDGFLSMEERENIKKPDFTVIAPLVKWGRPGMGPYTCLVFYAKPIFNVQSAIVSLPPSHGRMGLLGWAALGHETAGHDILHADEGLLSELADEVRKALQEGNIGDILPDYWADRIDETASDILGILNIGPAAGIGLIGYLRGLRDAAGYGPVLRCVGALDPEEEPHPLQILRGYLAASAARLLKFNGRENWADSIEAEVDKDLGKRTIRLGSLWTRFIDIDVDKAKESAKIVADILINSKMTKLENHSLGEIQNWRDRDEQIMIDLRSILTKTTPLPARYIKGFYAAHVVAAATVSALAGDSDIALIFNRMIGILKLMHDKNPSWGPLYVEHPSDIFLHIASDNMEEYELK